jgi:hypothetical protein
MDNKSILNESKSIFKCQESETRLLLDRYLLEVQNEIKLLKIAHAKKLKQSEDKKSLKVIYTDRLDELYHSITLIKETQKELDDLHVWSTDHLEIHKKITYIKFSLIPCIEATRGLLPKLILSSNKILGCLHRIRVALKNIL